MTTIAELKVLARAAQETAAVTARGIGTHEWSAAWAREMNAISRFRTACDPATIERLCDLAELGEAWEEAEVAVGAYIEAHRGELAEDGEHSITLIGGTDHLYWARAEDDLLCMTIASVPDWAPTPAAALRALTAKLKERA